MEHLTKQQIVLLTLLVSFVTSIATGIFTVSLMQQAPQAVTQTINKIVERTVEKVVPALPQKAQVVRQEVTTVIKEDDLVVAAVEKSEESIVRIYGAVNNDPAKLFLGFGVVVSAEGAVATDRKLYADNLVYFGVFSDGAEYSLELLRAHEGEGALFFKAVLPQKDKVTFLPAVFGDSNRVKLGQKVIGLAGEKRTSVLAGIVTGLQRGDAVSTTSMSAPPILGIETNLPAHTDMLGSPLFNLSAEVLGIYVGGDDGGSRSYLPTRNFSAGIASTSEPTKPPQSKINQ